MRCISDVIRRSQKRHLFWDIFETSYRRRKKDVFFEMFLRGLWNVSLNGDLFETSQRYLMPAGRRQWKAEEKNRVRRSKRRRQAKKVIRDLSWNSETNIDCKWWKTVYIKTLKYRLWNAEIFTVKSRFRNVNTAARDRIKKGRN